MGLFGGGSKSTTNSTTNYNDSSKNASGTVGDLSSDNKITSGDYYESGLTSENLDRVMASYDKQVDSNNELINDINENNVNLFEKLVASVQKTTESAIAETGNAYAESKSELRNFVDSVRPIALYAAIAAIFYFIFWKRN